jgi:soluble lytic murein transglycosylase
VSRHRGLILAVVLGVGAAVLVSRIDFQRALREVTLPLRHEDIIRQQAAEKDLDPSLIAAVIYAESRFREGEVSEAGARGLMQVTPQTAREIANKSGGTEFRVDDLFDPEINIRYGCYQLRALLDTFGGNEVAALAAYHAGPTAVAGWGGSDLQVDDIGFAETRAYVQEVLDKRDDYRTTYPGELRL